MATAREYVGFSLCIPLIKELDTAAPYVCNNQIKGVHTLSSPSGKSANVLGIFNKQQRRKRRH